ncbi:thymidylate kinase [Oxobacter pfennigii]|uniref:Thymidylate kinase n=1 Tax=Oxobacter pfennigii TaxID=36849 RepID=A0A0P8Y8K1_9CLOT|nr:thymidylate kinase [Oxobacter pfennigii]KPU43060.1 thymidylate kinase [Oxobacter pfennigii]
MEGKLIIIEGSDSSGKATQAAKLFERLRNEGHVIKKVEFPNYNSPSSTLVKMYLGGSFGKNPADVDPYIASSFYAVDRYASYKTEWERFYKGGGIIISDRYTTSNMLHQAAKLKRDEKDKYLNWLWDYEFNMYKLPIPNCVIFLNMPPEFSQKLMEERANKITGKKEKDIHESHKGYLADSYNNALYVSEKYSWEKVDCVRDNNIRTIDEIHDDVYSIVKKYI